jgi:hypothetical protein
MLYGKVVCNWCSTNNLEVWSSCTRFNSRNLMCVIGFISIYHHFKFETTFILAYNALLCSMTKKHVKDILKPTHLEGWLSSTKFDSNNQALFHWIYVHLSPCLICNYIIYAHNALLFSGKKKDVTAILKPT